MIRKSVLLFLLLGLSLPLAAQSLGDQSTAGFTSSRTYSNADLSNFRPPLRLFETISLSGITNAQSIAVFENRFLVGQGGSTITYQLFNRGGDIAWTRTLPGSGSGLNYVPALAGSLAILGGASTTTVRAVNLGSGLEIWSASVGDASGRFPILTDDLAIYGGADKIVVARASTGEVFWQLATSTSASALSVFGNSLYFLDKNGALRSYQIVTGQPQLDVSDVASDGASVIPTEKFVFVSDPGTGFIGALNSRTGAVVWSTSASPSVEISTTPGLALATGRLFAFLSNNGEGNGAVTAYDPASGLALWSAEEEGEGIDYGFVSGNVVYYYAQAGDRIRARDVASGDLLWSIPEVGVRGLTAAKNELVVLLSNSIKIYNPTNEIFMAQMANGSGQTTLLVLSNMNPTAVQATVRFFGDSGDPMSFPVQTFGTVDHLTVSIPAFSSTAVQTEDVGGDLLVGWVQVVSDRPLRGASIFQYAVDGDILREAGVADSLPTGSANVLAKVGEGFDTGIAVINPTAEEAFITLHLLNAGGSQLAEIIISLAPGEHIARYVDEFFPEQVGTSFEGTIVVDADVPVSITALRTKDGPQISSYPVGQLVR